MPLLFQIMTKDIFNDDDLWHLCHNFNRPVFVDTKKRRFFQKDNVYWKINKKEYDDLIQDHLPNDDHLIVTLGSGGALWNGMIYKPQPVKVFDVCGAGDTFLAELSLQIFKNKKHAKCNQLCK